MPALILTPQEKQLLVSCLLRSGPRIVLVIESMALFIRWCSRMSLRGRWSQPTVKPTHSIQEHARSRAISYQWTKLGDAPDKLPNAFAMPHSEGELAIVKGSTVFIGDLESDPLHWETHKLDGKSPPSKIFGCVNLGQKTYISGKRTVPGLGAIMIDHNGWKSENYKHVKPPMVGDYAIATISGDIYCVGEDHLSHAGMEPSGIWKLVNGESSWTRLDPTGTPPSRTGVQAVAANGKVYTTNTSEETDEFEVNVFDPNDMTWTNLGADGDGPTPRVRYPLLFWKNKLVLFGGLQFPTLLPLRAPSDELFTFDLDTCRWEKHEAGAADGEEPPKARYSHTATIISDRLILAGGKTDMASYSDVYSLDVIE